MARPAGPWADWSAATADLDPPFAVLDRDALLANAADLVRRAAGTPVRIASKSLRVRGVLEELLRRDGFAGVLAFTLPEALWLARTCPDVVVGYPTADRAAIAELAGSEAACRVVTLMIDDVAQLDLIDSVAPPATRPTLRVCLELDASWKGPPPLGRLGAWRSPLYTPDAVRSLAVEVARRPGFTLVGLMAYEAQIAGVSDALPGRAVMNAVVAWMKSRSEAELSERRSLTVAAVAEVAPLEFVNGGGTGSIESTIRDGSVTEVAAGSGLFAGHYFDSYAAFTPRPATGFALSVVRKPRPDCVTVLGGGWIASGPPGQDRLPLVAHPAGLRMLAREGAGEVQTPLEGDAARTLGVGDRVWFRHAKSGELSERINEFVVVGAASSSTGCRPIAARERHSCEGRRMAELGRTIQVRPARVERPGASRRWPRSSVGRVRRHPAQGGRRRTQLQRDRRGRRGADEPRRHRRPDLGRPGDA
ncbi:alanine racemase [Tessaracoccus coleopterorum]|uniref:alanine racemase n=1 Tax=Tessaracoccus coleopterorum TaxID=2714950 RepID=UPI001E5D6D98|nr:alanine racemase [Tessaracoccus coleopterorum]